MFSLFLSFPFLPCYSAGVWLLLLTAVAYLLADLAQVARGCLKALPHAITSHSWLRYLYLAIGYQLESYALLLPIPVGMGPGYGYATLPGLYILTSLPLSVPCHYHQSFSSPVQAGGLRGCDAVLPCCLAVFTRE